MRRRRPVLIAIALLGAAACLPDRVPLQRGPLGPARYEVRLGVSGSPAVRRESVVAALRVTDTAAGAKLELRIEGTTPISAELSRGPNGQLRLDAVENVPPRSAGEADLASLVGQLDPPLPPAGVRIGQRWSATRTIKTETIDAQLASSLRLVRFKRVGGADAAELRGTVTGRLKTTGSAGVFEGPVRGETAISWALQPGRVASSETRLVWAIPGGGDLRIETSVRPA